MRATRYVARRYMKAAGQYLFFRVGIAPDVEDRLRVGVGEARLDERVPLGEVGVLVPDVHLYSSAARAITACSAAVNPSRRALIAARTASAASAHSLAMPRTMSGAAPPRV